MHRTDNAGNSFIITYTDIDALAGKLGLTVSSLGVTAGQLSKPSETLEKDWVQLSVVEQEALRTMLNSVYNPKQLMQLSWTIGETIFEHSTLFWGTSPSGELVWLSRAEAENEYQLQWVTIDEIKLLLTDILSVISLADENINQSLSPAALLSLLGASGVIKEHYHKSMLNHQPLELEFNAVKVQKIINEAKQNDPRWTLCFWEKTLPINMNNFLTQVNNNMPSLIQAGWIEPKTGDSYQFTSTGELLALELLNEKAKLAITIASAEEENILIQENILLIRGPLSLWLFSLNGENGGVGRLNYSGWQKLSTDLLTPLKTNTTTKFCPSCGTSILKGGQFCSGCGNAL